MTPREKLDELLARSEQAPRNYDEAIEPKWRAHHMAMMLNAIDMTVPAVRAIVESHESPTQSHRIEDAKRCLELEDEAHSLHHAAATIADFSRDKWPDDVRRKIEAEAKALMTKADGMLEEVREIVARHT